MRSFAAMLAVVLAAACAPTASRAVTADSLRTLLRTRQYGELIRAARTTLTISAPSTRAESLAAADVAELMAEACWRGRADRPADAESLATDAVVRRERLHGPGSFEVARVLPHLARVRRFGGDRQGALSAFQRSLDILESCPGRERELATTLVGLGNLQQELYDHAAARRTHERAVEIRTRVLGPNHHDTAIALVNLGNTLRDRGETADALLVDSRALRIFEAEDPMDTLAVLTSLTNTINSSFLLSQEAEALPLCERYLQLSRRGSRGGEQGLVNAVENMAYALAAVGRVEQARGLYAEELELLGAVPGSTENDRLRSWRNLGLFEAAHGNPDSAFARLERARAGFERLSSTVPGAPAARMILELDLGKFLFEHGLDSLAGVRFAEALRIGSGRGLADDHPDMVSARQGQSRVLLRRGELARAFEQACRATQLQCQNDRRQYDLLSEQEALSYRRQHADFAPLLVSLALRNPAPADRRRAYDALVRSHALVLDAMAFRRRLRADHGDSVTIRQSHELATLVREEARAHLGAPFREPSEADRQRRLALERSLVERDHGLAADFARRDVGLAEVESQLRAGEALVHYMRLPLHAGWSVRRESGAIVVEDSTRATWLAWIVRGERPDPDLVVLGDAGPLDRALDRWVEVLADDAAPRPGIADAERRRRGAALRRVLWDPLAARLADARRVYLVPDGTIYRTPLVTLPTGSGGPLLETGPEFVLLSSPRDLAGVGATHVTPGEWLAIADPDFDSPPPALGAHAHLRAAAPCDRASLRQFARLPGTREEARGLEAEARRHEVPVRILAGTAATIENLVARSTTAAGLHIATHGYALGEGCDSTSRQGDPMLRFGILLAGANASSGHEGWMSAAELATLDFGAAELVVVSACHSGAGEVLPGEGLFGIARALTLAGARSAVLCTGPIEDDAAAYWMREFYSRLFADRTSSASAVRAAAIALRHRLLAIGRDRPSQWGAFVGLGTPR